MGMWAHSYIFVLLLWTVKGAPILPCPDGCTCNVIIEGSKQELTCSSLDFIEKIYPNYLSTIVSLYLRHLNLTKIDLRLHELHDLQKLDLAHNSITGVSNFPNLPKLKSLNLNHNVIKDITAEYLPKTLKDIDISNNKINHIPKNFLDLKNLKNLYLKNNPISCTCDTIVVRNKLINSGVVFSDKVECRSPQEHKGKAWEDVTCELSENDLFDDMIGDEGGSGEGEDGSGSHSAKIDKVFDDDENTDDDDNEVDQEYIFTKDDSLTHTSQSEEYNEENDADIEGSNDYYFETNESTTLAADNEYDGSGDEELIIPVSKVNVNQAPKACYFNCSTPHSIINNSTASPPSLLNGAQIIFDDFFGETTTANLPSTEEPPQRKTINVDRQPSDVVIIHEDYKNGTHELERQQEQSNAKMSTTFMIVCGLLMLMIAIVIYSVYKRRAHRRNRLQTNNKEPEGKELMPLTKTTNEPIKEKIPLMNGQNRTNTSKSNENNTTEPKNEEDKADFQEVDDEVELRNKENDNLLTPKMERVTIQVKEFTAPKTPILVNRHLSDDGNIISTPTNQH